jgi:hypothetical protein
MTGAMTPINLNKRLGKRYRIGWDPAYDPRNRPKDKLDPWAMQIPGKFGTIYPYCESTLAVMIDHHVITANRVAKIPGVEIIQDGDEEKTFRFPIELFDKVAELVKPHRKPQLTEEQSREAVERLRGFQFRPAAPTGRIDANSGD